MLSPAYGYLAEAQQDQEFITIRTASGESCRGVVNRLTEDSVTITNGSAPYTFALSEVDRIRTDKRGWFRP